MGIMKIVLINTSEQTGGAAVACRRLMTALRKAGGEVKMLVGGKCSSDPDVVQVKVNSWISRLRFLWERLVIWINNGFSRKNLFAVSLADTGVDISKHDLVRSADVIHLHWINNGFLSLDDVRRLLALGKPVVWTLHDMWMLTGICHCARDCGYFKEECRCCPLLRFPGRHDLSHRVWRKKKKLLDRSGIHFVTCSQWLLEESFQSHLLQSQRLVAIPNPIDTGIFRPEDKQRCRRTWGLPRDKKLLLFGAERVDNPLKGIAYLVDAIGMLAREQPERQDDIEVVVFGKSKTGLPELPFPSHFVGFIASEVQMTDLYNAVDVYITPSLADNLPNTVMEAMACGTPVVGFHTGGIPEMVDHKVNGWLAGFQNSRELMRGICWTLFEAVPADLSREARAKVLRCYFEEKVSRAYLNLYEQACRKN